MAKEVYGWEYPDFTVPEEVAARFHQTMTEEGQKAEDAWNEMFANYKKAYPELAQQFEDAFDGKLPENWDAELPTYELEAVKQAVFQVKKSSKNYRKLYQASGVVQRTCQVPIIQWWLQIKISLLNIMKDATSGSVSANLQWLRL